MTNNIFPRLSLLLLIFCFSPVFSQETTNSIKPFSDYQSALELYKQKKYVAAQALFSNIAETDSDANRINKVNAIYYDALCAYHLNQQNTEFKLLNFLSEYSNSSKTKRVQFQLGKYYFNNRKYRKATAAFRDVDRSDLSIIELQEYNFKMAYCALNQSDIQNARVGFSELVNTDSQYAPASKYYLAHLDFLEKNFEAALVVFESLKSDPNYQKIVPYYLIQIYYYQKDFERILADGPELYAQSNAKQKAEIAKILGAVYFENEDYEQALEYYESYQRSNRSRIDETFSYQVGVCYFKTKQYQQAIRYFQNATRGEQALAQNSFYYLGHSYLNTDQKKFASNAFKSSAKLDDDPRIQEEALFNYAKLSIELGHDPYNEAINALNGYLEKYPNSNRKDEVHNYLVQLYINTKNYRSALSSIEQLQSKNPSFAGAYQKIYYYSAIELFNDRRNEEAIEYFTKAIQNGKDSQIIAESNYWIAEAFYKTGNYWAANKYYNIFINKREAKRSNYYALSKYNIAYIHFKKAEYESAIRFFTAFIRDQKNNNPKLMNDVYIRIGDSYFINRKYQNAITNFDKAIRYNQPNKDYAIYQKALSYGALGKQNNKIITLEQMITSNRNSAFYDDAMYELGTTYLINNQNEQAALYFNRLVRENPRSPYSKKALLRSGLIYYNNDQNNKALASMKKVILDYPGSAEATEALSTLKTIYVEANRVNEFFDFANSIGQNVISVNEQDSLLFSAAENQYLEGNEATAVRSLNLYIRANPNGAYLINANFYLGEIEFKNGNYPQALEAYTFVNNQRISQFSETSLLKASRINYNKKDYAAALNNYNVLLDIANNDDRRFEALIGQMRCNFKIANYGLSIDPAKAILRNPNINTDQIAEAHFILAKSYFETNYKDLAKTEFTITEKLNNSVQAAESKYYLALMTFENLDYVATEKLLFELSDQYAYYDYWLAKGFILLADNYIAQDNAFQAKQTLQSIIDNYQGADLRNIAVEKLNQIKSAENQ